MAKKDERKHLKELSEYLRQLADKVEQGEVISRKTQKMRHETGSRTGN